MFSPHLFIGLGSRGTLITCFLKKNFLEIGKGKLPPSFRLLAFDSQLEPPGLDACRLTSEEYLCLAGDTPHLSHFINHSLRAQVQYFSQNTQGPLTITLISPTFEENGIKWLFDIGFLCRATADTFHYQINLQALVFSPDAFINHLSDKPALYKRSETSLQQLKRTRRKEPFDGFLFLEGKTLASVPPEQGIFPTIADGLTALATSWVRQQLDTELANQAKQENAQPHFATFGVDSIIYSSQILRERMTRKLMQDVIESFYAPRNSPSIDPHAQSKGTASGTLPSEEQITALFSQLSAQKYSRFMREELRQQAKSLFAIRGMTREDWLDKLMRRSFPTWGNILLDFSPPDENPACTECQESAFHALSRKLVEKPSNSQEYSAVVKTSDRMGESPLKAPQRLQKDVYTYIDYHLNQELPPLLQEMIDCQFKVFIENLLSFISTALNIRQHNFSLENGSLSNLLQGLTWLEKTLKTYLEDLARVRRLWIERGMDAQSSRLLQIIEISSEKMRRSSQKWYSGFFPSLAITTQYHYLRAEQARLGRSRRTAVVQACEAITKRMLSLTQQLKQSAENLSVILSKPSNGLAENALSLTERQIAAIERELAHSRSFLTRDFMFDAEIEEQNFRQLLLASQLADDVAQKLQELLGSLIWNSDLDTKAISGKPQTATEDAPEEKSLHADKLEVSQLVQAIERQLYDSCHNALAEYGNLEPALSYIRRTSSAEEIAERLVKNSGALYQPASTTNTTQRYFLFSAEPENPEDAAFLQKILDHAQTQLSDISLVFWEYPSRISLVQYLDPISPSA